MAGSVAGSASLDALHVALIAAALFVLLAAGEVRQRRRQAAFESGRVLGLDVAEQLLRPGGISARTRALLQDIDARTWLDTTLKKAWRRYQRNMSAWLQSWLEINVSDSIVATLPGFVKSVAWSRVELGDAPPTILRCVPVRVHNPNALVLELKVEYHSSLQIAADLALRTGLGIPVTVPILLKELQLSGTLRVEVDLVERRPWAGTVSLSFTTQPALDFALSLVGAVDLAQAPLLGNALRSALHDCLAQQMTWPQRLELPLERWAHPLDAAPRMADGVLRVRLLCAQRLPAADMTGYSNAFVVLSVGDSVAQTAVRHQTLQPVWCEEFCLLVPDRQSSVLRLHVLDSNRSKVHDLLGTAELRIADVHEAPRTAWLRLEMPRNSRQADWLQRCSAKLYSKAVDAARIAVQVVYSPLHPTQPAAPAPGPAPLSAAATASPSSSRASIASTWRRTLQRISEQGLSSLRRSSIRRSHSSDGGGSIGEGAPAAAAAHAAAPAGVAPPVGSPLASGGRSPAAAAAVVSAAAAARGNGLGSAGFSPPPTRLAARECATSSPPHLPPLRESSESAREEGPRGGRRSAARGGDAARRSVPASEALPRSVGAGTPSGWRTPSGQPSEGALRPEARRCGLELARAGAAAARIAATVASEEGVAAEGEREADERGRPNWCPGLQPSGSRDASPAAPAAQRGGERRGGGGKAADRGAGAGSESWAAPVASPTPPPPDVRQGGGRIAGAAAGGAAAGGREAGGREAGGRVAGGAADPAAAGAAAAGGAAGAAAGGAAAPSHVASGSSVAGGEGAPNPIEAELGLCEDVWADLYESGSVVLKAGSLLKSNDRAGNYRERWAELELSLENDHRGRGESSTGLSAQLRYYKLEMSSAANPSRALKVVGAAWENALEKCVAVSHVLTSPANLSREAAGQFGRRCQGAIRLEPTDEVREEAEGWPWRAAGLLCAAPQVISLHKHHRLWYLRAGGRPQGRSWLKALQLTRELVSGAASEDLVARARLAFEARSVRRHSSRASGIGQQPAGTATDGDTGWQGGGVAGMMRARHEAESKAADAALVARLATATTGDGDRIPRAREVGQSAGLSSRPGRHNGAGSSQTEPVEGCVEGLVLLVELLEARDLSPADGPLGACNPFAEVKLGPHAVRSDTLYDTTEPQWGRAWELWGGASSRSCSHLFGGFHAAAAVLTVRVCSERRNGGEDALGVAEVDTSRLLLGGVRDLWLPLTGVANGAVRVRIAPYSASIAPLGPLPPGMTADLLLDDGSRRAVRSESVDKERDTPGAANGRAMPQRVFQSLASGRGEDGERPSKTARERAMTSMPARQMAGEDHVLTLRGSTVHNARTLGLGTQPDPRL